MKEIKKIDDKEAGEVTGGFRPNPAFGKIKCERCGKSVIAMKNTKLCNECKSKSGK